ncbi:hypothetical protein PTI98_005238 [Pleurotus ostreatus]|nr:hypothetical protein PTI98_005238 [Pleurotus ostreatus]
MSSRMSRKYFCDCARFCKRGRDVSRATFYAHAPFRFNPLEDEDPCTEATDTGTAILAEVLNGILDIPNKAGEIYADAPRLITGGPWAIDGDGEQTQSPNPLQIYGTNGPGHILHHNQGDGRSSSPAGQIQRPGRVNTSPQVHLVGGEDHSDGTVGDKEDNANLALDDHRNRGHFQIGQKATNSGTSDAPDSACKVKDALKHRHYEVGREPSAYIKPQIQERKEKEKKIPSHRICTRSSTRVRRRTIYQPRIPAYRGSPMRPIAYCCVLRTDHIQTSTTTTTDFTEIGLIYRKRIPDNELR